MGGFCLPCLNVFLYFQIEFAFFRFRRKADIAEAAVAAHGNDGALFWIGGCVFTETAVYKYKPATEQCLRVGAGQAEHFGDNGVEPLAGRLNEHRLGLIKVALGQGDRPRDLKFGMFDFSEIREQIGHDFFVGKKVADIVPQDNVAEHRAVNAEVHKGTEKIAMGECVGKLFRDGCRP